MICMECGEIIEFYSAELEAIQDAMAAKHRFEVKQHLLRILGICVKCRRAARERKDQDPTGPTALRAATGAK
jgi:Fur family ferric uptake transcriptional regulator